MDSEEYATSTRDRNGEDFLVPAPKKVFPASPRPASSFYFSSPPRPAPPKVFPAPPKVFPAPCRSLTSTSCCTSLCYIKIRHCKTKCSTYYSTKGFPTCFYDSHRYNFIYYFLFNSSNVLHSTTNYTISK